MPTIPIISRIINAIRGKRNKTVPEKTSSDQINRSLSTVSTVVDTSDPDELLRRARAANALGDVAFEDDKTKALLHYKKALEYCMNVKKQTQTHEHHVEMARASYQLGRIYISLNQPFESKIHYELAKIYVQDIPELKNDLDFSYKKIRSMSNQLETAGASNLAAQNQVPVLRPAAQPSPALVEEKIASAIAQSPINAKAPIAERIAEAKKEPVKPETARNQAFAIMRTHALNIGAPHQQITLLEQKDSLINAYKLLQNIPNKEKNLQDLSRLLVCANALGNVLHQLKDPRALDVVQRMGIYYCDKVAADPDHPAFRHLLDANIMARQFASHPLLMTQYIFAKADCYEQLGNRYLEQKNRQRAAECFKNAKLLCQQGIPEEFRIDSVAQRIDRYKLAENKAMPINDDVMQEVEKIIKSSSLHK